MTTKYTALIAALLLSAVAAISQWHLYYSIQPGALSAAIGGLVVLGIILSKIVIGSTLSSASNLKRVVAAMLLIPIMLLSVFSEVFFFKSRLDTSMVFEAKNSTNYRFALSDIQSIERQIEDIRVQVKGCNVAWETKCIKPKQDRIEALQSKKEAKLEALKTLGTSQPEAGNSWQSAANILGISASTMQWIVFSLIGLLMDSLSIFGLYVFGKKDKVLNLNRILVDSGYTVEESTKALETLPVDATIRSRQQDQSSGIQLDSCKEVEIEDTETEGLIEKAAMELKEDISDFDKAKRAILTGEITPAVSKVRKLLGIQYEPATAILGRMKEEGYLDLKMKGKNKIYSLRSNVVELPASEWLAKVNN